MASSSNNISSKENTNGSKAATPIGDFQSIEDFTKAGFGKILEASKSVAAFPKGTTRDLYCAYPAFGRIVDSQSDKLLGLISKVLKRENVKGNIQKRQEDEKFEMLLEFNDTILERINQNLDQSFAVSKSVEKVVLEKRINVDSIGSGVSTKAGSWNSKSPDVSTMTSRLISAKNIMRPQIHFPIPVDNKLSTPFVPKIKDKPNSLKPLAILPEYDDIGNIVSYLHPYEFELTKFEISEEYLKERTPTLPSDLATTELVYVDTVDMLNTVLDEFRLEKELAVDLEHHSYRTFLGFTCLLQISSRKKDYIFDALKLREELHILNNVFTDPKIVKIFHGADSDIDWLQRDLSLYVVNMFDTHQASHSLNFARHSLAHLLKHYCDIEMDKTFQLADWRIRPLPHELTEYARKDTHYLIYVYERMTNDLLRASNNKTNLLRSVYQRSNELCKHRYKKPILTLESHMDMFLRSKRVFDNRQMFALQEIFQWRDALARREDESCGYVLPNHMLMQISENLPREMQGILACCNPVPPLVRQNLHAIHQIILRAREQPLVKPVFDNVSLRRAIGNTFNRYNSKLHCPHDLTQNKDISDNLPTLLKLNNRNVRQNFVNTTKEFYQELVNDEVVDVSKLNILKDAPIVGTFGELKKDPQSIEEMEKMKKRDEILSNIQYISPYQRYLAVLPLVEKERREAAKKMEIELKKRQLCPAAVIPIIKKDEIVSVPSEPAEDVSMQEMVRRQHKQSKKKGVPTQKITDEPSSKRFKLDAANDDTVRFVDLPPTKKQLKKAAREMRRQEANKCSSKEADIPVVVVDDSDDPPDEMPISSKSLDIQQRHFNNRAMSKSKKKSKKNSKLNSKSQQSSNKPVEQNFDYKSVDFKKFQGGAQKAKGIEVQQQHHGKVNKSKAKNKKLNKLFTFSNVKVNKN